MKALKIFLSFSIEKDGKNVFSEGSFGQKSLVYLSASSTYSYTFRLSGNERK
jgi:hypothetical protein